MLIIKEAFVAPSYGDRPQASRILERSVAGINKFNVMKVRRCVHWKHVEATC